MLMQLDVYEISLTIPITEKKLEIWGRAQHEAARRPKSDWKYNLFG